MLSPSRLAVVDVLRPASLLALLKQRTEVEEVLYFERTDWGERVARWLRRARWLKATVRPLQYRREEIERTSGRSVHLEALLEDAPRLTFSIVDSVWEDDPILLAMRSRWNAGRMKTYFTKALYEQVNPWCLRVRLTRWLAAGQGNGSAMAPSFWAAHMPGEEKLREFAGSLGISARFYPAGGLGGRSWVRAIARCVRDIGLDRWRALRLKLSNQNRVKKQDLPAGRPSVAVQACGWGIGGEPAERSDLFWTASSGLDPGRILVYFVRSDIPANAQDAEWLRREGFRGVAMSSAATESSGVPVWRPGWKRIRQAVGLMAGIVRRARRNGRRAGSHARFWAQAAWDFVWQYTLWREFLAAFGIRLYFNMLDTLPIRVAADVAIDEAGGISFTHQYVNFRFASIQLASAAHIVFSFSPASAAYYASGRSAFDYLVPVGYIFDGSFVEARAKGLRLREQLRAAGADFVVCFLDENASEDRDSAVTFGMAAEDYEWLLRALLSDPTLGLVIKPKNTRTFEQLSKRFEGVLRAAESTGRCVVLSEGRHMPRLLPCVAAAASDVTVAFAFGATAALESRLVGTPTVLLERLPYRLGTEFQWGESRVVFERWEDLFESMRVYRNEPAQAPGFGDWSAAIATLDPFRDGRAGERIGTYLRTALSCLEAGQSREEAIQSANRRHQTLWGTGVLEGAAKSRT